MIWIIWPPLLFVLALGCNATCLRDSDCMGAALCTENRCILPAGPDAGRSPSTPETPAETDTTPENPAPPDTTGDAGSVQ